MNTTTYSIPLEFNYSSEKKKLSEEEKKGLHLPNKSIIRIFGTVGSGKGTVSAQLAKFFNIPTFDTGKVWRSVTYGCIKENLENTQDNIDKIFQRVDVKPNGLGFDTFFDGKKLENSDLRNPEVDAVVSQYSKHRNSYNTFLTNFLKSFEGSVILDGRGGRTPYLNAAETYGFTITRIFLFVSLEQAAHRRTLDYQHKHPEKSFDELKAEISETIIARDCNDYNHIVEQNLGWVDAETFALDTTKLSIEDVYETVLYTIKNLNI